MEYLAVHECVHFRCPCSEPICYIEDTPENIAAFIASSKPYDDYAFITSNDEIKLFSMGKFLDLVFKEEELEGLQNAIIPMQIGKIDIPEVVYVDPYVRSEIDQGVQEVR